MLPKLCVALCLSTRYFFVKTFKQYENDPTSRNASETHTHTQTNTNTTETLMQTSPHLHTHTKQHVGRVYHGEGGVGALGGTRARSLRECVAEPRLHALGWELSGDHPIM